MEGKDKNDFYTCIPKKIEFENLLRKDLEILKDNLNPVQSETMSLQQNSNSFDKILIDSVLVHNKGHKNSDPTPIFEPRSSLDLPCEYVEDVEGNISTPAQNENLISSDPLDDVLDNFLTSCGPLESFAESKEVNEWIDFHIDKDLNEWEIHLDTA